MYACVRACVLACVRGRESANIDIEIQHRIRCACFSYGRLKDRVFSERGFRTATKILVYKAVILTTLLYGCETWVAYRRHVRAGHVRRIPDTRIPKQLMHAELSSGKRKTGGQWKRYKDQLKSNLKMCEVDLQWETTADDRAYW